MRIPFFPTLLLLLLAQMPAAVPSLAGIERPPSPFDRAALQPGAWVLVDSADPARRSYRIPAELPAIRRLPAPERRRLLDAVRRHDANVRAVATVADKLTGHRPQLIPEYRHRLEEIALSVEPQRAGEADPLHAHEPLLQALPAYTRIHLFAPAGARKRIAARLAQLGLEGRTRVHAMRSRPTANKPDSRDSRRLESTPWAHDTALVATQAGRPALLKPLAFGFDAGDIAADDLDYLAGMNGKARDYLRTPLFYRAGNIMAIDAPGAGLTVFVGESEFEMNTRGFAAAIGMEPGPQIVLDELARFTGARRVIVLPNSDRLFHIDQYLAVLDDGLVALLRPLDAERLPPAERRVLDGASAELRRLGLRIADIPTTSERIAAFQSPANIVPFTHRDSGRRTALVPVFSDRRGAGGASLDEQVLAAYRKAGVTPIPVEDRFHRRMGNTHCAVLVLK